MINLRRNKDLAAVEGRRIGLDSLMTALAFVLLLVIVVIPITMIVYNAFFYEGKFTFDLIIEQLTRSTTISSMWNTIKIGALVTFFGTVMGFFTPGSLGAATFPARN